MRIDDMYPSTYDCAKIAGAGEDLTLRCMENSRQRVKEHHVRNAYANEYTIAGKKIVEVCAIGAVLAEDGFRQNYGAPKRLPQGDGATMMALTEEKMSQEAREAIALLNAAALELHPEAADYDTWSGPLEWINQVWRQDEADRGKLSSLGLQRVVKKEILRIYDHAIEQRRALSLATS